MNVSGSGSMSCIMPPIFMVPPVSACGALISVASLPEAKSTRSSTRSPGVRRRRVEGERPGQQALIGGNEGEGPPVGEGQVEVPGIGGIDQAQADDALRHRHACPDRAVDHRRVAEEAVHEVGVARPVDGLAGRGEALVLEDEDEIVDAGGRREAAVRVVAVVDDEHAGEAGVDARCGLAVEVGVVPERRRRLVDRQARMPFRPGRDRQVRAAVERAGNEQAVPVDGDRHIRAVDYARGHLGSAAHADDGPEIRAIEAERGRGNAGDEFGLAGNRLDLEGAARRGVEHRQRRGDGVAAQARRTRAGAARQKAEDAVVLRNWRRLGFMERLPFCAEVERRARSRERTPSLLRKHQREGTSSSAVIGLPCTDFLSFHLRGPGRSSSA